MQDPRYINTCCICKFILQYEELDIWSHEGDNGRKRLCCIESDGEHSWEDDGDEYLSKKQIEGFERAKSLMQDPSVSPNA